MRITSRARAALTAGAALLLIGAGSAAATAVASAAPQPAPPQSQSGPSDSVYYKNCTEARRAGVTPLYQGDPGYASHLDRDHDGIACE